MHPSTDPREAALRWHWGQLFLQILVWLNLEERWDGISSVRKIWSQKRWLSVLMGLTQYFNQLTLSHSLPIPDAQSSRPTSEDHFFISPAFPPFSLVLLCPVSLYVSFFSRPSLCFHLVVVSIYCLLTISVSLCVSRTLFRCLNTVSMKTNATPRIHDVYFPAKVNMPPCNKDRSSPQMGREVETDNREEVRVSVSQRTKQSYYKLCLWVIASKSHQQIGQWDSFKSETIVNVFQMSVIILCCEFSLLHWCNSLLAMFNLLFVIWTPRNDRVNSDKLKFFIVILPGCM